MKLKLNGLSADEKRQTPGSGDQQSVISTDVRQASAREGDVHIRYAGYSRGKGGLLLLCGAVIGPSGQLLINAWQSNKIRFVTKHMLNGELQSKLMP